MEATSVDKCITFGFIHVTGFSLLRGKYINICVPRQVILDAVRTPINESYNMRS